ncbi:hypothetical protein ANO14919_061780 [Xylariales sp. No.14919]|nr:hypothetical protein ANO14919_061780 [Xylariales sp. No.14919]
MSSTLRWLQPRSVLVTADNQATGVSIATWFLASTFLTVYLSGQTVKYTMLRRFRLDDYILLLSIVSSLSSMSARVNIELTRTQTFALPLSVLFSVAASNGLGNKIVPNAQLDVIQKTQYAADILYISVVGTVKLSLLVFIRQIAIDAKQTRLILYLLLFHISITIASLFASAFQCRVPRPWETLGQQCFDTSAFWTGFGVLDILTEFSVILTSIVLVWNVHLPTQRKLVVVGCFAPRILVAAAAATRLAFLVPSLPHNYWAWNLWRLVVSTEVQVCLSISTACVPSLKPLFEAIEAGVWHADDLRRRGLSLEDLHSKGYLKESESWLPLEEIDITRPATDASSRAQSRDISRSSNAGGVVEASPI